MAAEDAPKVTLRLDTSLFFDRPGIQRTHNSAVIDTLRAAGAAIRDSARKSIQYRPRRKPRNGAKRQRRRKQLKSSPAGSPPFRHVTLSQFGIHKIMFYKDPKAAAVIVGPITNRVRTKPPTEVLEFGGSMPIRGLSASKKGPNKGKRPARVARVGKRPYMNPALGRVAPSIPASYAEALATRASGQRWAPVRISKSTTRVTL
jgi:hypothetical protein